MIVKIMKGDQDFREATKSSTQCSNEVYVYKEVIPYYQKFLDASGSSLKADWTPKIYYADYKIFPELSDARETILALENLSPFGYRLGPRTDLNEKHLRMMIKHIATYHSVFYAMKIKKDPMVEKLAQGLIPLSFLHKDGQQLESYRILYTIALERFFRVVADSPKLQENKKFVEKVEKLKAQYQDRPMVLMQKFLETDDVFTLILHGDYNRNNVLFKYGQPEGFDEPESIKMIDFQECRYASLSNDLSFFMYMNSTPSIRDAIWDSLLELYHETLMKSLTEILKCTQDDERVKPYGFTNFLNHFKKFAFYGTMIGIHFIPWMACPEDECHKLSHLFETDIKGPELHALLQVCGGADVDERITSNTVHAFNKGYMDIIE